MVRFLQISDPVTLKRIRRFRARRRAWYSLWALASLFALSLVGELLCNDRPLLVVLDGRLLFPVLRFYPEDRFLGNGKQTRPDYSELARSPRFAPGTGNRMVFPPVPHGPYSIVDPAALGQDEVVTATIAPAPRVASVDVGPDFVIARAQSAGAFFDTADDAVPGLSLRKHWALPAAIETAVAERFQNRACAGVETGARGLGTNALETVMALASFTPRAQPPRTVRVTLRESAPAGRARQVRFTRNLAPADARSAAAWRELAPELRAATEEQARLSFVEPAAPRDVPADGAVYRITCRRNDVTFPHRPCRGHWMGIDSAGRDVLARVLYGLRTAMIFGLLLVAGAMVFGTLAGAVQGYYGGLVDIAGQRLTEIWSALPFLYVIILMGSVLGQGLGLLLLCYGLFNWIGISYYVRGEFLRLRKLPFVEAARCMGIPPRRIILRHILPNALTPIITFFPFYLVGAIGSLAALDYLGFGLPPPTPSWGELLQQAQQFRWAWWLILYPSLALFTVMTLGVFVGEGVRDAFDPRPFSRMD